MDRPRRAKEPIKNLDLTLIFAFLCLIIAMLIITNFVIFLTKSEYDIKISVNSEIFKSPVDIITNCMIAFLILIGGTNAARSFLKTGYLPDSGDVKTTDVPEWKVKQLLIFTIIMIIIEGMTIAFQLYAATDKVDFYVKEITMVLGAAILSYVSIRTIPKVGEGVYFKVPEEKDKNSKDTPKTNDKPTE